jgi:hypothetical protein
MGRRNLCSSLMGRDAALGLVASADEDGFYGILFWMYWMWCYGVDME